ncbi:MAG: AraC family transcriptional regulator [Alphaproteobacteria bacterium]
MSKLTPHLQKLKNQLSTDQNYGVVKTLIDRVYFFWSEETIERNPLVYDARIVIIGQGSKIGYLDDKVFKYNPDNYLIVSMPLPFECATYASKDEPLLGINIDIDLSELHELVALASQHEQTPESFKYDTSPKGVEPAPLNHDMTDSIIRLLKCLNSPLDSKVLGASLVKEIIYRVLLGQHGSSLYALTQHNTHYTNVAKSISYIRNNYTQPITVDELANHAGMSTSVFHRSFKDITGHSPVQYLKKIRLTTAKSLIIHENMAANLAANKVGYESSSQFSREFKKYFGVPPKHATNNGYL